MESKIDLTSCLSNCSNNGLCKVDSNFNFICECFLHFSGNDCSKDLRLCSKLQCMNDGNCSNVIIGSNYDFECNCSKTYNGKRCQNIVNLCQNRTCNNQGLCQINSTEAICVCFPGYSGFNCETAGIKTKIIKVVGNLAMISAIMLILCFIGLITFIDVAQFLIQKKPKVKKNTK